MLDPNQFNVNDAWLVFQLNDAPINTEGDGSFNAVCLMDAASCLILAMAMVPTHQHGPSELEVRRLFKDASDQQRKFPSKLFVPADEFGTAFPAQAERHGVSIVTVAAHELSVFTDEARLGFRAHVQRPRAP